MRGRRPHRGGGDVFTLPGPACPPQDTSCELRLERYFTDPSSTGYVPYCDPGSLYYDPESCEDMLP